MVTNSLVYEKAYSFAIRIVKAYKYLKDKQEFVLSKQLLRCGTSVGANIAEANGAISDSDFSAKMSIAYKEILETKYWLSLLKDTGYITNDVFEDIFVDADEIAKMIYSILKTTRINKIVDC
ncbi:four helix bundle protein [Dysgonomonas sp. PFB1-18]|uniref:four helix bundle protein n=1 Tax=unclassified Dysgonomonas TaxID=2630389 RepID=UPI002473E9A5|nr:MULTISPECIES: four helix bundle protein [unclassified Dysgonomonas]MDH6308409.1 four helix bundle protein [Dysgonomonas sp. PF1-14]MDH6337910.1 four helix bundle protein [Dysgonomonas sp. PF1-16]MDH6379407.1 four helix bundle protein [Dysgonomonas sp. PFB1-18]MDH6396738.1 four helix bundle protein [Dysgonomonas sp. PF1-23]